MAMRSVSMRGTHAARSAAALISAAAISLWALPAMAAITLDDTKMVSVAVFGVTPGNTTNNAAKLQEAVNAVVDKTKTDYYSKTLYFPPGIYMMEKAVVANEKRELSTQKCGSHEGKGTIVLIGATDGTARPVLKLKSGLSGWGNSGSPKTLLTIGNKKVGDDFGPDCAYRDGLRGIDIDVSGYAGAIGLHFDAAQDSFLEDVKVIATNAYTGIKAVPGRGMAAVNIEVEGGQYGIDLRGTSLAATLVGVKLTNQTKQPLTSSVFRGLSVTGLQIATTSTSVQNAITLEGSDRYQGHLSLYDASIALAGNGSTRNAISNSTNRTIELHNVYTSNVKFIVDHGQGDDLPKIALANGATQHVLDYVRAPRGISGVTGLYRTDGVSLEAKSTNWNDQAAAMGLPTDPVPPNLISRHVWTLNDAAKPWRVTRGHTDADVIKPNFPPAPFDPAVNDSTQYIQDAIDAAALNDQTVYLPAGYYTVGKTITLRGNTRLIGVPGLRSTLGQPTGPAPCRS